MVKKQGGPLSAYKKNKLIKDIRALFESGDIRHYSIRDLSKKFDIAKDTVSKYLDEIRQQVDPQDLQYTQLKFKSLFEEAIATCELLVQNAMEQGREKDARESIRLLLITIKEQTDFLERFFYKPKAQETINVQTDSDNVMKVEVIKTERLIDSNAKGTN